MLAFTFANPWMLGWLAAAVIPWLIHWFFRGRQREQAWAAMDILLAALKRRAIRLRHQEWLLIAVRTLLITVAVVAAAGPSWDDSAVDVFAKSPRHHVLVLDATYSMSCVDNGRDRLAAAKQAATQIVDQSGPADSFSLVVMPDPPNILASGSMIPRAEIKQRLENVSLVHTMANLQSTLNQVSLAINRHWETTRGPTMADVYWISDWSAYTWSQVHSSTVAEQAAALREMARSWIVDLGRPTVGNAYVLPPRLLNLGVTNAPLEFEVQVGSHGGFPAEARTIELYSEDKRLAVARLDDGGPSAQATRMNCLFGGPGDYHVRAHLQSDSLSLDNDAWRIVRIRDHVRVLCVVGGSRGESEAGYLRAALESRDEASRTPFFVDEVSHSDLEVTDLTLVDCVMFCDVPNLTRAVAMRLDSYLRTGGAAIFFCGGRVNAASYRGQSSIDGDDALALFPAIPTEVAPMGNYAFDPLDYHHPLLDVFRGRDGAGLLTTPIFRYHELELIPGNQARIALAFDTGDPAIVEGPLGAGRVIVVALPPSIPTGPSGADAAFSMWPAWPSFVPLVHEMVEFCLQGEVRGIEVGQPWLGALRPSSSTSRVAVIAPNGQRALVPVEHGAGIPTWRFDATWLAGPYEARDADTDALIERFAVRLNNEEGDLARIHSGELPAGWNMYRSGADEAPSKTSAPRGTNVIYFLLAGLVVLVGLESFTARRMRRGHA